VGKATTIEESTDTPHKAELKRFLHKYLSEIDVLVKTKVQ
jgi:hypothetical protein